MFDNHNLPFQTRRQSGELRYFITLKTAMIDAADTEVWKISFPVGDERVRLVRNDRGQFVYEDLMATVFEGGTQ